jgi:Lipopolysaccharide-assembly
MNRRACSRVGVVLTALGCALTVGCAGYHVGPVSNPGYRSVAVPMFKNKTLVPQLEAQITNGIIKRLQTDGTLQVESPGKADVILVGEILHYRREELRSSRDDSNQPREYRIIIEARVEAHHRATGEVVIKPTVVTGEAATFVGSDLQTAEYQVLPLIADDLSKRVVTLLVERW